MKTHSRPGSGESGRATVRSMAVLAAAAVLLWAILSRAAPPGKAETGRKPVASAAPARENGITADFDAATYGNKGFPGWCNIYAVFRNEKKKRPLFGIGRGSGGAILIPFDLSGLSGRDEPDASSGQGRIDIEFLDHKKGTACFFRGEDWNTYTCGQWVQAEQTPVVEIALSNIAQWKSTDQLMGKFLNPDRKRPPPGTPDITPKFTAQTDIAIRVGDSRAQLKAVPCKVTFSDLEKIWQVRFEIRTKVAGANLGLTGDDAGDIAVLLVAQVFCAPPKGHGSPTPEGQTAAPELPAFE